MLLTISYYYNENVIISAFLWIDDVYFTGTIAKSVQTRRIDARKRQLTPEDMQVIKIDVKHLLAQTIRFVQLCSINLSNRYKVLK